MHENSKYPDYCSVKILIVLILFKYLEPSHKRNSYLIIQFYQIKRYFYCICLLPVLIVTCFIHVLMAERSRAFVHGRTFLHSRSGTIKLVGLAAWSYVPVQSYSLSLRVFYRILVGPIKLLIMHPRPPGRHIGIDG